MRAAIRFLSAILATIGLSASATAAFAKTTLPVTWTEFQYSADNNATFDTPPWDVAWRADIGKKSNGGITVVGETVYIDSFDHNVYAFNALNGRLRWHRKLPNVLMNAPLVASGIVVVGTGDAKMLRDSPTFWVAGRPQGDAIYALSTETGEILWSYQTVGEDMPTGAIVLANDRPEFVFTNGDDHVYGLDLATGKLLWKRLALGVDGMASLTVVNNIVYGISTLGDAGFLALQATDPKRSQYWSRTWAVDPARNGQYVWTAPYGVADASVTADDGLLFTEGFELANPKGAAAAKRAAQVGWGQLMNSEATFRTTLTALDAATGKLVWQYKGASGPNNTLGSAAMTSDAVASNGVLYAPLAFSKQLGAFDERTGHVLWMIKTKYPVKTSAVLKDGYLFFGDSGANLYVVKAATGKVVYDFGFPGPPSKWGFAKSAPVIVGNTLFISQDRWLYALRVSDLLNGHISQDAAPPTFGPSGDWCPFDPQCTTGSQRAVIANHR